MGISWYPKYLFGSLTGWSPREMLNKYWFSFSIKNKHLGCCVVNGTSKEDALKQTISSGCCPHPDDVKEYSGDTELAIYCRILRPEDEQTKEINLKLRSNKLYQLKDLLSMFPSGFFKQTTLAEITSELRERAN